MQAGRLPGREADHAGQVDDGRGRDEQRLFADEACRQSLIGDLAAGQAERTALHHALVIEGLCRIDGQRAAGFDIAGVGDHWRADRDVTRRVAAVVGFDARGDGARVSHFARVDLDPLACRQALLVDQLAGGAHVDTARVGFTGHLDAGRVDVQRALCRGLRHVQVAVGVDLDIAAAGSHVARRLHADALLGADQPDRIGIHAAQRRGIDRQLRLVGGIAGTRRGRQRVVVDVVGAGNDVQLFGVDIRVDLRGTGNQVELIDRARIQAFAVDADAAAVHCEVIELAVRVQHGRAGAEGDAWGIDETATVAAHAIRVSNDNPRRLPRHFGVAVELAGIGAGDFIEDGAGGATAQLTVTQNIAAQLGGLYGIGRVVENHAFAVDVVLLVLVVRQPGPVGCSDVDHRHAIAGLAYGRVGGAADRDAFGLRPDRLPEHDVRQQQCQQAFGHPHEVGARSHLSRRLARQKFKLANVHIQGLGAGLDS
ncbi:hypothetical protein ALQ33_200104 [Pseudomonas syringae pv. philadelphi]|uniref:Uncharacterized protein n=1 Tax=Pseudomonas syringae pv. philadelphi TaxID=251706 RepID=A0A3M3Y9U5_9PSED|nr:hypothetical protein ALQ33_200104 [Pseudomonas syringae pv. philadelphi]